MGTKSIFNYSIQDLQEILVANGFNKFAAQQIFDWIYVKLETDFNNMSNLKKDLRDYLMSNFNANPLKSLVVEESKDGTIKILFLLDDKKTIETVLMPQKYGQSVCVTTQVGCKMACKFCASGLIKTERNLETNEIVRQIFTMNQILKEKFKDDLSNPRSRVSHIVVMGIGEPMDNFENVMKFIEIINETKGFQIGARHITISTCGVVPKIIEFADMKTQINLAISLHASNNEVRSSMMPINKAYPIEKLLDAVSYYIEATNRRITFEYILIEDVNDKKEHAVELARLIRGMNAYVNLIPYNEVKENPYRKSTKIDTFFKILKKEGINAIVRKEFGADIDAACGQLRAKREGVFKNDEV
ncbi:23S rRNA (adenine(2503)-C(2))-methyltransferase RlmN [Spiroplasma tabanidicola]|uniref:Probable dual-specificity RNA methyltransferase RlmN n=1 Tax=Spiroplasma tabanidicola TaxID=324079 RepID=A0A6I6CD58_9MOLU|nr:23S rRNA (adenine(2503)-C(2))-methyltransferase RlmN [Spiroplasma tabanidicola]QGS52238.1 23S rRNA (adenine2503-C2)-methyltransferase [Spiroplasma tabanidicola]